MKTRERYWGLYDYTDGAWLDTVLHNDSTLWSATPKRRRRFDTFEDAKRNAETVDGQCAPRPFYVTRRPRPLPVEAQAVIDAVKKFDAGSCGWVYVSKALALYEATK